MKRFAGMKAPTSGSSRGASTVGLGGGGVLITGDRALDEKLRGMPLRLQKKLSRKATRNGAYLVLKRAVELVPVDEGDLEESLVVRAMPRSKYRFGHQVQTRDGFYQGDEHYGAQMEFGTKERRHKSGKRVGSIQAVKFAFLRPAVYDQQDKLRKLYVNDMQELIHDEAQRGT